MDDTNHEDPAGTVPIALVDALFAEVAAALHDRPVQHLVAAKLMVESATGANVSGGDVLDRGVAALDKGARISRDVMWALSRMAPDGEGQAWVEELFQRAAGPDGLAVVVDPAVPVHGSAERLLAAAHDVVGGALLRGGAVHEVAVTLEGDEVMVSLLLDDPRPGSAVWVALARWRLAGVGGRVEDHGAVVRLLAPVRPSPRRAQ